MKVIIGIISWLPDDDDVRKVRLNRLKELIVKCRQNFELPIMIIAQNYHGDELKETSWLKMFNYDKLGITGAREELRKKFLESSYDYIICLDDDFELSSNKNAYNEYLRILSKIPNCLVEYENYLMNLCAISRWMFEKMDFDTSVSAELGTGFEDWVFISVAKSKYPTHCKRIKNLGLPAKKRSELVNDKYSTWIDSSVDKDDLTAKSKDLIKRLSGK